MKKMQADMQRAVWESDCLKDYGRIPQSAGVEHHTETLSAGQSGGYSRSLEELPSARMASLHVFHGPEMEYSPGQVFWDQPSPTTVAPDMSGVTSCSCHVNQRLQYYQQPYPVMASGMYYNRGLQYYQPPYPVMVPSLYYHQGLQYWQRPYPMMVPGMDYGPQDPMYWKNPPEWYRQAGPSIHHQNATRGRAHRSRVQAVIVLLRDEERDTDMDSDCTDGGDEDSGLDCTYSSEDEEKMRHTLQ